MSTNSDSRHLYLQVIDAIKRNIKNGIYKEKEKLASEFELAKELNVSRAVLREAIQALEEENIVTVRPGVGIFINPKPTLFSGIEELNSVTNTIEQSGKKAGSHYLSTEVVIPTEDEKEAFKPKEINEIIKVERIRTADNEPVVFCVDKVPHGLIPLEHLYEEQSMFMLMEEFAQKRIDYAVTYLEPIGYNERIHDLLNCDPEQALLLLKQIHYTKEDEPVLYSVNYFRPDMFSFHVLRKRT